MQVIHKIRNTDNPMPTQNEIDIAKAAIDKKSEAIELKKALVLEIKQELNELEQQLLTERIEVNALWSDYYKMKSQNPYS